jgi:DNA polymerase
VTTADSAELDAALALLARGLAGAIEVSGLEHLPRPIFSAPPAAAATTTTSAAAPMTAAPTIAATGAAPTAPTSAAPTMTTAPMTTAPTMTAPTMTAPTMTAPTMTAPTMTAPTMTAPTMKPLVADLDSGLAAALAAVVADPGPAPHRLKVLCDDVLGACTRCKLHRGRNSIVFGAGSPSARLVFVGEGPGESEDRQGIPFVGAAGQLLTKMISAMGFGRDDVYICNVVKCRPPNNRDPEADEVDACEGFLKAQLGVIRPQVIVGLGKVACSTLLRNHTPITKLRGTWQSYEGVDFMPTYHPSYLLREERDPEKKRKREAWGDLQLVMERLKQRGSA